MVIFTVDFPLYLKKIEVDLYYLIYKKKDTEENM